MTAPTEVRDRFLLALAVTVDAMGCLLTNLFKLAFLFPAIVCVMVTELLVRSETKLFAVAPIVMRLPVQMPTKASVGKQPVA